MTLSFSLPISTGLLLTVTTAMISLVLSSRANPRARRSLSQQGCHRNILVNLFPMDTDTSANETPIATNFPRGLLQARKPRQRGHDLSTVGQANSEAFARNVNAGCDRTQLNPRSAHPMPPGRTPDFLPRLPASAS